MNEPIGRFGILEAGAGADDGVGDCLDGLVLADHAAVQLLLEVQELLHLAFHQAADGNAGPARHDVADVFLVDLFLHQARAARLGLQLRFCGGELLLELDQLAVLQLGGAVEIVLALRLLDLQLRRLDLLTQRAQRADRFLLALPACAQGVGLLFELRQLLLELLQPFARRGVGFLLERLALDLQLHDSARHLVELGRHGVDLGAQLGRRLVDEVDGLVGQEAVGDVALRQHGRGDDGAVLDAHPVVHFVALAQTAQDGNRVLDGRLLDDDRLEAALQRGVLLDVLAVLVEGRGADAVQLAARQHRLEQVAGIHRAFCRAGADDGVQLVDEQNDLAGRIDCTSLSTAFRRSSNSPRNLAPATSAPMSSATSLRSFKPSGTSLRMMRCARPSTIAVLPTPGSPMRTGLFLVRRDNTWMTRRISSSRPMTGSNFP